MVTWEEDSVSTPRDGDRRAEREAEPEEDASTYGDNASTVGDSSVLDESMEDGAQSAQGRQRRQQRRSRVSTRNQGYVYHIGGGPEGGDQEAVEELREGDQRRSVFDAFFKG